MMTGSENRLVLKVEGMPCAGCAEDYEKVLRSVEGILEAAVDYKEGLMTIRYNPDIIDRRQAYMAARKLVRKATIMSES